MMTQTSLPFLCELAREALEKQGSFVLRARGFSMTPFIEDGDDVKIVKTSLDDARSGDVMCYGIRQPKNEFPVLRVHRALYKTKDALHVKGDTLLFMETVLSPQVIGRITAIRKKGVWTECKTPFGYLFFALPALYGYALAYKIKTRVVPGFLWDTKALKSLSSKLSALFLFMPRAMLRYFA